MLESEVQSDESASNSGGTRATIRLQYVAVNADLAFAETFHIRDGAQAPADQPLYLLRPAGVHGALSVIPCISRPGQHAVFGGHPAPAAVSHERRHRIFDARCAQDMSIAKLRKAGSFRILRKICLSATARSSLTARPEGRIGVVSLRFGAS